MRSFRVRMAAAPAVAMVLDAPAVAMLLDAPAVAQGSSCLEGLGALDRRMEQDGFWLSGHLSGRGQAGVATPPGMEPDLGMRALGLVAPARHPVEAGGE